MAEKITNTPSTAINAPPYTIIDKNFPIIIEVFFTGDEYNNFIEPL